MPVSPELLDLQKRIESLGPDEPTKEQTDGIFETIDSLFDTIKRHFPLDESELAYVTELKIADTDSYFTRRQVTTQVPAGDRGYIFTPSGTETLLSLAWWSDSNKTPWSARITDTQLGGKPRRLKVEGLQPRSFSYTFTKQS